MQLSLTAIRRSSLILAIGLLACQQTPETSAGLGPPAQPPPPPPPPPTGQVASVVISPSTVAFTAVGETKSFVAVPRDSSGNTVAGVPSTWTSSDNAVVTVSATGVAQAVADGSATIRATAQGVVGTASASVATTSGGTTLFSESFENGNFSARGWYDNPNMTITSSEAHSGTSALEIHFPQGANTPRGSGGRHLFAATGSAYLSYWVKYSANWIGSGNPWHPHEFYFVTTEDGQWVGPAFTHLTVYVEHNYQNGGIPVLAAQDGANIDVTRANQNLTGVTENRSAHGCNGNTDGYTTGCYATGGGNYNNGKAWRASQPSFLDTQGPGYKNDWHRVEAYFQLNTIQNGIGQTDGIVQYWFDGQLVIDHRDVLLRTGAHPTMEFNQMLLGPYIGSGSPADQYMWIDDLEVKTRR